MIKNYLIMSFLITTCSIFSQEIYLKTGKNFTKYIYKDDRLQKSPNIQSGTGSFYEVGLQRPFINKKLFYEVGISLNEYNAIGGNSANSYRWDTQYLGLHGGLSYSLLTSKTNLKKNFDLLIKTGLNGQTIIYGKQQLNGVYYDLLHQEEFKGIVLESSLGFTAKYLIASFGDIRLGYNFCQSINVTNASQEKLSFNTNQIQLGVHFNIN